MTSEDRSTFLTDHLSQILETIARIAEKSAGGSYIYRGEAKHFSKVTSTLYRQYRRADGEEPSITAIEQEILEAARKYTTETEAVEILSELQHYGGTTNLIDFTTDYLTALFFACDGLPLEDGRVILLEKTGPMAAHITEPRKLTKRTIVQKSIYVSPPQGFVEPDHVIRVPKDLKEPLLEYLRHSHSISGETIYNDLHGFIRQQNLHANAYRELHLAITYHREDDGDVQHAINHYTTAVALNPRLAQAYCGRGGAHISKGDMDKAMRDLTRAIGLETDHSCAYALRGRVYLEEKNYEAAIADLSKAISLNPEFDNDTSSTSHFFRGTAYLQSGDDVEQAIRDFGEVIDRELPPDIAEAHHRRGRGYLQKGDRTKAVKDFDRAIRLEPDAAGPYCGRGTARAYEGDYERAVEDFDRAIEIDVQDSCAYHNRGVTRLFLAEWEAAREDLKIGRDKGIDTASEFRGDFESVAKFEKTNGVEIPEDIAEILGG